jgi:hypothetical protein
MPMKRISEEDEDLGQTKLKHRRGRPRMEEKWGDYLDDLEAEDQFLSPGCYLMLLRKHHSRAVRQRAKSFLSLHA